MKTHDSREDALVNRFLLELLADREAGRERSLAEYQARYPGFEQVIAREHERGLEAAAEPGAAAALPGFPVEGQRIGSYRLVSELGRGGQGSVWRAEDTRVGRSVALKILRGDLGWTAEALARFRREVAITSKLDHPGICAVYDADTQAGLPYVAMQLLEGETLAERIQRQRREKLLPDPREVAQRIELAARALHAAHEAGVVHRDVKPANLITTRTERVVVLDFGMARELDGEALTMTGDVFGTPAYMSPEQIQGRPSGVGTDIWALGVTLYEALTLEPPFRAATRDALYHKILAEDAPDPSTKGRRIPRDLAVILATALSKEPRQRYASALDLALDLQAFRENRPIAARPIGALGRIWRWAQREPRKAMLSAGLLLAVLALAGLGGYLAARSGQLEAGRVVLAQAEHEDLVRDVSSGFAKERTLERLRELLQADPRLVTQRAVLAIQLARFRRFDEAWSCLAETPADQAEHRELARAKAVVFLHEGRIAEADELNEQLGKPLSELESNIASMFADLRQDTDAPERAFQYALRALLFAPGTRQNTSMQFLASAMRSQRLREAAIAAEVLVERWPDSAVAWQYAAGPWAAFDLARSRAAYEKAIELDPGFALAHTSLSDLLLSIGELDASERSFERGLALMPTGGPEQFSTLQLRAQFCEELGRLEPALATAERALAIQPQDIALLLLSARALRALERLDEFELAAERVLELDPDNAEALELLDG